jgi:nucleoid-associated protein YgaU
MEKQSKVSGGKGLALAGSAVAVVLVLLGFVFFGRMTPSDPTPGEVAGREEAGDAASTTATQAGAGQKPATPDAPQTEVAAASAPTGPDAEAPDTAAPEAVAPESVSQSDATPSAAPEAEAETVATTDQNAAAPAPADAATAPETAPEPAIDPSRPSFDTVRLAPDGEAVVAGRAMAGSMVDILMDGIVVGTVMTGADGAFAAFLSLPAAETPRVLTLATQANGTQVTSDQQVIIAPVQRAEAAISAAMPAASQPGAAQPAGSAAVTEASAPAVLLSDSTGVRVLQPATAADPTRTGGVVLDVISYTSLGDVLLQGRATAAADILIYLDNAAVTSAPVDAEGIWSVGLPGVSPGIYTLRLDEVDKTGKVLSRIETPFKREDRDEVAAIAAASAPSAAAPAGIVPADAAASDAATPTSTEEVAPAPEEAPASAPAPAPATATVRVVTVQPGNTLWAIARESYGEGPLFVRVFEANRDRIRNPDLIYPGQIFEIPE